MRARLKARPTMPIKIPDSLPAVRVLNSENIFVMTEQRASTQDIRPLKLVLLNLMPDKITTETQFARLLGDTPLQVELDLIHMRSHKSRHTPESHLSSFYKSFEDIRDNRYDGMVITGAPVEKLEFEAVDYWNELVEIMDWSKSSVFSTLHVCWAAQAGLYHHFGIGKRLLPEKLSGIYQHRVTRAGSMLFRGADDVFDVPHSRHTAIDEEALGRTPGLRVLAASDKAGVYALSTERGRQIFLTGHPEYDALTLDREYRRDHAAGLNPRVPENYYPDNDPSRPPVVRWRSHAHLLYANWLNFFVYQETPFDLNLVSERVETTSEALSRRGQCAGAAAC